MRTVLQVPALGLLLAASLASAQVKSAPTTTELAVTSGGNAVTEIVYGNAVQLTATVTAGGAAVAPGQVNFCDATVNYCTDTHLFGMAQLTAAGTASIKLIPAVGPHSYKVVFLGTKTDAASSSSVSSLAVTPPVLYPTTTALTSSGNPGDYTLSATVTGNHPLAPTGTVSFIDTSNNNYLLGTAGLGAGTATFSFGFFNASNLHTGRGFIDAKAADLTGNGQADRCASQHVRRVCGPAAG